MELQCAFTQCIHKVLVKWSGELSRISWASVHFCECHLATFETFYANLFKESTDT